MPQSLQLILFVLTFATFGGLEWLLASGDYTYRTREDSRLETAVFGLIPFLLAPIILIGSTVLWASVSPETVGALSDIPWWQQVALLLIADDMVQYWWHRASHSPLLWPLHRAHHSAGYMGAQIVYRNNFFYYALMPNLWISGFLLHLGLGVIYAIYASVKLLVIVGAHSTVRWDRFLYRYRWLNPLAWIVERVISTPATHFAHHALTNADGIGNYKGNFGNLLFFWDVLFGTAHITRQYPPAFGLVDDRRQGQEKWYVQLFFPLFRSHRAETVLAGELPPRAIPE